MVTAIGSAARKAEPLPLRTYPLDSAPPSDLVTAFAEDHSGNIWMGFYGGHVLPSALKSPTRADSVVVRYRDARFTVFWRKDGVPEGLISDLFVDHAGRLWIAGTDGGLGRVDAPNDPHPRIRRLQYHSRAW